MNQWLPLSNEDAKASYLKKLSWACNETKPVEPLAYSKMLSRYWRLVLMVLWEMIMQFSTSPSFIIQSEFNKNLLSASMYGHSASHFQYKKTLAPETRGSQWEEVVWENRRPFHFSSTSLCAAPPLKPASGGCSLADPPHLPETHFFWTPYIDVLGQLGSCSLQFSSVSVWALSLATKVPHAETTPYHSVTSSPQNSAQHMTETWWICGWWVKKCSLTNDGIFQAISSWSIISIIKLPGACATQNNILDSINITM